MERQKNQENIVLKLKHQIGRMMVQVDFLYRNGRELSQFDYDILMDRTRELYEFLIDTQAGNVDFGGDCENNNDVDVEVEKTNNDVINNDVELEIETPLGDDSFEKEDVFEIKQAEESEDLENNDEDGSDEDEGDEEIEEDEEDWEDEEDVTFHVEPQEEEVKHVVEEIKPVDNSLAARLQRQPITDIRSAVALNDKIMMVKELFMGSVERYDKIINELNEFPTMGGALVYLSELRIQLQWDIESEAFLKLQELVERRFLGA